MKNYVQINDNFFKVILDGHGKPSLLPVKPEEAVTEQFEKMALDDGENININMFQEVIDNARKDLKQSLERNLKSTVLAALGFEKDTWGSGYKVDHCNGRMSAVTDLIAAEVRKQFLNENVLQHIGLTDVEKEQIAKECRKEFKEAYKRQVSSLVWKEGEKLAQQHVEDVMKDLMTSKLQAVATVMLEKAIKKG